MSVLLSTVVTVFVLGLVIYLLRFLSTDFEEGMSIGLGLDKVILAWFF